MILSLFSARPDHPLADPKELKRTLGEIPLDNAFKAVDEISGWLESLSNAEGFRVDLLFEIARQLDDAAQPHLRKLARDYLQSPRLSKSEERKLWSASHAYWELLAGLCDRCLQQFADQPKGDKGVDALRPQLPLLAGRALHALGQMATWVEFRYGPVPEALWRRAGRAYLVAEAGKAHQNSFQLYAQQAVSTTVSGEYLHVLLLAASSLDSLMPLEIELADRLIAHFVPDFEFVAEARPHSVYWVDAAAAQAPKRMAKLPQVVTPSLRFFAPGAAPESLAALIRQVERGDLPDELSLGAQYQPRTVLPVLRHLALYWASQPPLREHQRHDVKTRLSVLHGFDDSFTVFAGDVARAGKEHSAHSWVVENVSLGGFGAAIDNLNGDWLKAGALISMQPEGGDNWVLGIVRRFAKDSESRASVGIQTLSRQPVSYQFMPRGSAFVSSAGGVPGIRLPEDRAPGEVRLVLPVASFDIRENLEYSSGGRRYLLTPIELVETGGDFEVARYREVVQG